MTILKPMLAQALKAEDFANIKYPVLCTPKLDGIRCLIINGKPVSRNFIDIPNRYVQKTMAGLPDFLDGELMVEGGFNSVQSAIMREDGEPNFTYNIFDYGYSENSEYQRRIALLKELKLPYYCKLVLPIRINDSQELDEYEAKCISDGYEGVMIRSPSGPYKFGRSTIKEGYLVKLKRFLDADAIVVGFDERMHNENQQEQDNFGHSKRSSHKENLKPTNMLGSLIVKDKTTGVEFNIGTGFDDEMRKTIWNDRNIYLGKVVTYKYQSIEKDRPRFPVFLHWRDIRDV